jgi:hypothetical protein
MNDEKLTFYYYNDGLTREERQQIASMLAIDAGMAKRYQEISRELDQLAARSDVQPPPDMVERWHGSLNRAVRSEAIESRKPAVHSWSFFLGVGVTAALAIGIGIGLLISNDRTTIPVDAGIMAASAPNAFVRGLQVHLRESEQNLSTTPISTSADRTTMIMNIINQNRRYEKVAEQNDAQNLARVLRAFELVLVQLAADDIAPQEAEALQAKLLFELNVVLTKLAREPSDEPLSI